MKPDLIARLFPQLRDKSWAEIDLNDVATTCRELLEEMFHDEIDNPFLSPDLMEKWVEFVHKLKGVDYSYGGWMEDRDTLWEGHYHKTGETVHLGVDFNVPAGTEVHLPVSARLVHSFLDLDQNGGWGGKLIFKCGAGHFILGHLSKVDLPHRFYEAGEVVGVVADSSRNGGWYEHLHVQCCKKFDPDVDGYSRRFLGISEDFPNPFDIL